MRSTARAMFNLFLLYTRTYTHVHIIYIFAKWNAKRPCLYISKSLLVPAWLINLCHTAILLSPTSHSFLLLLLLFYHILLPCCDRLLTRKVFLLVFFSCETRLCERRSTIKIQRWHGVNEKENVLSIGTCQY